MSNVNNIEVKTWPYKPSCAWFGNYSEKILKEFEYNFLKYEFEKGNMFHVTLKVDYKEELNPNSIDRLLSKEFQKYIYNLKRGKSYVKIRHYQAIKEFDETRDGQKYRTPHLHLIVEINERSQRNACEIFCSKWKLGLSDAIVVNSLEHLKNLSRYLTDKNSSDKKKKQMTLPNEYLDCMLIKRVYRSRGFEKIGIRINDFKKYKIFSKQISRKNVEKMKNGHVKREKSEKKYRYQNQEMKPRIRKEHEKASSYRSILERDQLNVQVKSGVFVRSMTLYIKLDDIKKYNYIYNNRTKSYDFSASKKDIYKLIMLSDKNKKLYSTISH